MAAKETLVLNAFIMRLNGFFRIKRNKNQYALPKLKLVTVER